MQGGRHHEKSDSKVIGRQVSETLVNARRRQTDRQHEWNLPRREAKPTSETTEEGNQVKNSLTSMTGQSK